ncbi:superoxide dismutase [Mn], mitochondrial [Rhizoclosmatium globosum]|uniref:Superoxide dismutase n=1 Tax=Rhizoclosmatium globosum TaxID=329046 RepID=A0A1Y2CT54_9FUNG|nr:superoxide dismutase [Mn], mitochondrial [Rhizoclosmatium globosum]|eukprot:ORY50076.1 superoxide dismutase [Mn], mitochondrial [Rhizoclosmatium globosum]
MLTRLALTTPRLTRGFAAAAATGGVSKFSLPDLSFAPGALEPFISAQIMEIHHAKHHQTYVNNLNIAIEKLEEAVHKKDAAAVLALNSAINFNYGGHVNHTIFWKNLAPQSQGGGDLQKGALQAALTKQFGSLDSFITNFNGQAAAVQGSGWGWLVYNKTTKSLEIATTSNQDPILGHRVPLLGIDVWEHAYYLQYKNVRPDYLKNIWNVVNWKDVSERYLAASQ